MIINEWKNLIKNRFLMIVLIAILTIPTIYTTIFLSSMWDPYGKVSNLPVAVVNKDKEIIYQSNQVHIGEDLVKQLKKSDSMKFYFVDENRAERGLKSGAYYMVLTIPENFSENAVTLMDPSPKKMNLNYQTNPGMNFIASKMSESSMIRIKDEVSKSVTAFYAKNIFSKFHTVEDGFTNAINGTNQLSQGLKDLQSGQNKLSTGMSTLSDKMNTFTTGTASLKDGITEYTTGVESVNTGVAALADGTKKLSDGLSQLNQSVSGITLTQVSLSDENKAVISKEAASQVGSYAQALSQNISTGVVTGIQTKLTAAATASAVTQAMEQNPQIQQMEAALINQGYTKENADQLISTIVSGTLGAAAGNISSDAVNSSISQGVSDTMGKVASASAIAGANGVVATVNSTMDSYQTTFSKLKSATQSLSDGANQVQSGVSQLYTGTNQLASKNETLVQGADTLNNEANQIKNAVSTMHTGSQTIENGITTAYSGSAKLSSGLGDGLTSLKSSTQNVSGNTYEMFSNPIDAVESKITSVSNNGSSMAAYMMTIAMWVAGMSFCMMYPIHRTKERQEVNGISFWIGKASVMYPLAIAFSLLMIGALYALNGLRPARIGDTILVACLSASAFMSVLYFFNVVLKKAGTYFMFIFMVIQLAGSTGTYPAQLSASFVAKITDYLPFTYTVRAFRSTISGGNSVKPELVVIGIVLIAFIGLTLLYYIWKDRKDKKVFLVELEG